MRAAMIQRLREVAAVKHSETWRRLDGGQDLSIGAMLAEDAADAIEQLAALALDMGRLIRRMDETGEHSEFWSMDEGYIIDGRFPR